MIPSPEPENLQESMLQASELVPTYEFPLLGMYVYQSNVKAIGTFLNNAIQNLNENPELIDSRLKGGPSNNSQLGYRQGK